eukprot:3257008-Rhodomonas_salina.2
MVRRTGRRKRKGAEDRKKEEERDSVGVELPPPTQGRCAAGANCPVSPRSAGPAGISDRGRDIDRKCRSQAGPYDGSSMLQTEPLVCPFSSCARSPSANFWSLKLVGNCVQRRRCMDEGREGAQRMTNLKYGGAQSMRGIYAFAVHDFAVHPGLCVRTCIPHINVAMWCMASRGQHHKASRLLKLQETLVQRYTHEQCYEISDVYAAPVCFCRSLLREASRFSQSCFVFWTNGLSGNTCRWLMVCVKSRDPQCPAPCTGRRAPRGKVRGRCGKYIVVMEMRLSPVGAYCRAPNFVLVHERRF